MGQVYKALDTENDEIVALKFLLPGADEKMMERLRVEAREHATLRHPNVVRLIDYLSYEDHDFLVMEYLDGGNLKDFLNDAPELKDILRVFAQACAGLDYIHSQGLVHRDLKPENLLLTQDGQLKIADLGMVRRVDSDRGLTSLGQLVGSTRFMAPEQILRSEVTPAADLYAIGVTLFEAITGELPFTGSDFAVLNAHIKQIPPPLRSRVPSAPLKLEELVANLLEKSPDSRPRSAGQVRDQLLAIRDELENPQAAQLPEQERCQPSDQEEMSGVILDMSQTFRNSMNGVLGMAHLLHGAPLEAEHRQYLEALEDSAESLKVAFGDLLDFARIRAGKLRLEAVPTNLRGLIQNVLDGAQALVREQQAALFSHVDVDVPDSILVDPVRLHQILSNLVHQSLRAARKGTVSLVVQREHDDEATVILRFSISDNVSNMTSQQAREMFLPHAQGRGGWGLNLFLTHHLVELMKGRCWVTSAPGRGSTYIATLRVQVCGEIPPATEDEPVPSLSILLADDQVVNQTLAKALLSYRGHKVETVFNGLEVLQALEKRDFDLILMDMMMPEMDGMTAIRAIREKEKGSGRHVPIIALTALDQEHMPDDHGAIDAYLAKPIDANAMARTIQETLRKLSSAAQRQTPFELSVLLGRVGNSQRHAEMMVQIFQETHQSQLDELEQAFRRGEIQPIMRAASNLQSSLLGICAFPAARAAQALEKLARESRLEAALHARRQLLHELEYLQASLREQLSV